MRAALLCVLLATTACLRSTEFVCASNDSCGTGTCEATGYCSFIDSDCTSGRRYGELSGRYANACVDTTLDPDGGVDPGCMASYTTLAGAPHLYRVIASTAGWDAQRTACAADSASSYLAIPDDMAELAALNTAANSPRVWVGIGDQAVENTFATVRGGTLATTDPMWDAGEPNNSPSSGNGQGDCVTIRQSTTRLADDRCGAGYVAVCECEP